MSDDARFSLGFGLFVGVCVFTGFMIGRGFTQAKYREEAIKRGFAEYNATTGEWQWKGNSDADR